jgi:TRAP-type C4-dicarboxylate transport system permease small subunit
LLKVAGWSVMLSMAAIAVVIPYEVFGRYVLGRMSTWTGEFSQYALVWASMMGGAVGLKRGYQVGITALTDRLAPGSARFLQGIGYLCMLAFFALMTYYGIDQMLMNAHQTSATMGVRMSIPYSALPIGFLVMFFVTLEQWLDFWLVLPSRRE